MGEVYLAEDTRLHRRVAIKVLPASESTDEAARSRLLREARAAAMLDHPAICGIHEVGEAEGRAFIVMQYVEGETLAARLERKPLEVPETIAIIPRLAEALEEAHAHHLIHRDIKPQNLMMTARGQVKVLDFGLAKMMRAALSGAESTMAVTAKGSIVGTPLYMSPEQLRGEE